VFTHVLLADEINRCGPKTQSALLEAMQEQQVTAGGQTYPIAQPFCVLATNNPIEQEGTYPLPEAQLDRFLLRLRVRLPAMDDLVRILDLRSDERLEQVPEVLDREQVLAIRALAREVPIAEDLKRKVAELIHYSAPGVAPAPLGGSIRLGLSPRAGQALLAAARVRALMFGRFHVAPADLDALLEPALAHRLLLGFGARAEGLAPEDVVQTLAARVGLTAKR